MYHIASFAKYCNLYLTLVLCLVAQPQSGTNSAKTRSGSIQLEDVAVENLKKIDMPKPFAL
jgi:hypothetical protein